MKISNNILKEHLKNVYFVTGGAYGGKTTMTKLIEKKYGMVRYRQGDNSDRFAKFATPEYQPALSIDRSQDWYEYFAQPVEEYHKWLTQGIQEELEFVIIDLIKLSQNQKVIADVMIPIDILKEIADYSQVVLLFAPVEMKRKRYFDREDKQGVIKLIRTLPNSDFLYQNVLNTLTYKGEEEIQEYYSSGFKCIERTDNDTIEDTLQIIEEHFRLNVH